MSRIVVCLIVLVLAACTSTPEPSRPEASVSPSASRDSVLPSIGPIPTAPPRHSSDSMRAVLNAFRGIGIELTTNEVASNGELVLKANVDDNNIRIVLASAAGDQYQLRTSSVLIDEGSDPDTSAEVLEAFAVAASEMSDQEEAADFFREDLTAEEGGRSLTVRGKDGHNYELATFFENGELSLSIAYAGDDPAVAPSARATEEALPSD